MVPHEVDGADGREAAATILAAEPAGATDGTMASMAAYVGSRCFSRPSAKLSTKTCPTWPHFFFLYFL